MSALPERLRKAASSDGSDWDSADSALMREAASDIEAHQDVVRRFVAVLKDAGVLQDRENIVDSLKRLCTERDQARADLVVARVQLGDALAPAVPVRCAGCDIPNGCPEYCRCSPAAPAPVAQPGEWALVPKTPTDAMRRAATKIEWGGDEVDACWASMLDAAPAAPAPMTWERHAVAWLRGKAAEQAQNNERWPRHAACYPSWIERVKHAQQLADDLEREAAASNANHATGQEGGAA